MSELLKLLTDAGIGIAVLVIGLYMARLFRRMLNDERASMQAWLTAFVETQKVDNEMREKILVTVTSSIEKAVEDMKEVMLRIALANRDQSNTHHSIMVNRLDLFEEALREAYPDLKTWDRVDKQRQKTKYEDSDFVD